MRRFARFRALALTSLLLLPVLACGDDGPSGPPPVGSIQVLSSGITGVVGASVSVQVRVDDENGSPIQGIEVAFSVISGGGSVSPATTTTGASGTATASWTLGETAGSQSLRVTSGSVNATVTATSTPAAPAALELVSGGGQEGTVGDALPGPVIVEVTDRFGNPRSGESVTFAVTGGGGSVSTASATTGTDGRASTTWTLGSTPGTQTLGVSSGSLPSLTVTAEALAGAPESVTVVSGDGQTGEAGAPLANPVVVRVTDEFGNAVGGVTVTFTASQDGSAAPSSTQTDPEGRASTTWSLGTTAGEQTLTVEAEGGAGATATATAEPGPPAVVVKISGDDQSGPASTTLPERVVVEVRDEFGNPVSGAFVAFSPGSGSGNVSDGSGDTDAEGRRSALWTLGDALGEQTLRADVDGADPVVFTATATSGPPAELVVISGGSQSAPAESTLPNPIVVEVRDAGGNAVPNATVTFTVIQGGGSVDPATDLTGTDGRASTTWTLGPGVGTQTLRASVEGADPVTVSATAEETASAAAAIENVSGDGQTGEVATTLPQPLVVEVQDADGNPLEGVTVTWGPLEGSVTPGTSVTAADGRAETTWTLGTTAGSQELQASVDDLGPAIFDATATPAAAVAIEVERGDDQTAPVSTPVPIPPQVRVTDEFGNGVAGVDVTFATDGGGSVQGASQATDADGLATVEEWTVRDGAGSNTLNVTGSGLTSATFTATGRTLGESYDIEIRFVETPNESRQQAFTIAQQRWERVIVEGLPEKVVNVAANGCNVPHPAINETVDDVVIFAQFDSIDGGGSIIAQAGPCDVRGNRLAALGVMRFDTADIQSVEDAGLLDEVVEHEMGHVLGFLPFTWRASDLIVDEGTANSRFVGMAAIARFEAAGGTPQGSVPLETDFGGGTRDGHWDEDLFDTELMTGFIDTTMPRSAITVGAFHDMGYTMDFSGAAPYEIPGAALRSSGGIAGFHLKEQIIIPPR